MKVKISKQKKKEPKPSDFNEDERDSRAYKDAVWNKLCHMRHRDIQQECIIRGMPFEDIINKSHHVLVVYYYDHFLETGDPMLIEQFDNWMEEQLEKSNADPVLRNPVLRFSYVEPIIQGVENKPSMKVISAKVPVEDKPKREKDEAWGITTGTKKYLTYELVINEGLSYGEELINRVKEQFPEAEEKSIKIWVKRAIDLKK